VEPARPEAVHTESVRVGLVDQPRQTVRTKAEALAVHSAAARPALWRAWNYRCRASTLSAPLSVAQGLVPRFLRVHLLVSVAGSVAAVGRDEGPGLPALLGRGEKKERSARERGSRRLRSVCSSCTPLPVNVGPTAGQGSAGQGSAGQGSAGQGSAGQGSAGQGSAGQGSAGQGSAGEWRSDGASLGSLLASVEARWPGQSSPHRDPGSVWLCVHLDCVHELAHELEAVAAFLSLSPGAP
jgi:hypothetical protein